MAAVTAAQPARPSALVAVLVALLAIVVAAGGYLGYQRLTSRLPAVRKAGAVVHWARDAEDHNRIVHELLAARGVTRVVKSKSMLTEECGFLPPLLS